jgi:hypothetical protein
MGGVSMQDRFLGKIDPCPPPVYSSMDKKISEKTSTQRGEWGISPGWGAKNAGE